MELRSRGIDDLVTLSPPGFGAPRPEDFAATIYDALGLADNAAWHDEFGRPHFIYHGRPIRELF
ncbi:MAG: hypothetical protein IH991_22695 [Planctomycetes bacterium]|nr:hypothetical protein [Planctomycetota bacterium]